MPKAVNECTQSSFNSGQIVCSEKRFEPIQTDFVFDTFIFKPDATSKESRILMVFVSNAAHFLSKQDIFH